MRDEIEKISNKTDFVKFLELLSQDFEKNLVQWQNQSISEYLERIASWVDDYSTCPANDIEWEKIDFKILARIFYMGKIYE